MPEIAIGDARVKATAAALSLAVALVRISPLRERLDELPELVDAILGDLGRRDLEVSEVALAALRAQSWPGNVRESRNLLSCSVAFADPGTVLEPHHARPSSRPATKPTQPECSA
jgi:DNA-binding NtrC family response regulator